MNRKMLPAVLAALAAALPVSAADAMDVATFLAKADGLEKQGLLALASSDYKLLKAEVQAASTQLRAERTAAQRARRKPAYCPPAQAGLTPAEIVAHFRTIAPAQRRRTQVKDALRTLLAKKYPCPR